MGTITGQAIIDRATTEIMNDADKARFSLVSSLAWLNEAIRYVCSIKPSAYARPVEATLVAGTYQNLPDGVNQIVRPAHAGDLTTPGRSLTLATYKQLDAVDPDWRSMTKTTKVRHIITSNALPEIYEVYPPALAGTKIVLHCGLIPDEIAAADAIPFDDTYDSTLVDLLLSRLYQKSAEYAGEAGLAASYMQSAMTRLAAAGQSETANQPEVKAVTGEA